MVTIEIEMGLNASVVSKLLPSSFFSGFSHCCHAITAMRRPLRLTASNFGHGDFVSWNICIIDMSIHFAAIACFGPSSHGCQYEPKSSSTAFTMLTPQP
jgi:hypothetical protein